METPSNQDALTVVQLELMKKHRGSIIEQRREAEVEGGTKGIKQEHTIWNIAIFLILVLMIWDMILRGLLHLYGNGYYKDNCTCGVVITNFKKFFIFLSIQDLSKSVTFRTCSYNRHSFGHELLPWILLAPSTKMACGIISPHILAQNRSDFGSTDDNPGPHSS